MIPFIQDIQSNSPLLVASYGNNLALGFKGTTDFIERCFNWAVNTGVIGPGATLNWYYGKDGKLAYVCPESREDIKKGVALQLRAELVQSRAVPYLNDRTKDEEWDEEAAAGTGLVELNEPELDRMAEEQANQFMTEHVMSDSFMSDRHWGLAPIYDMASPGRAESGWSE